MVTPPIPDPPQPPDPRSCCQRRCEPCIFDYYDAAFADWAEHIRALNLVPDEVLAARGQSRARRPW